MASLFVLRLSSNKDNNENRPEMRDDIRRKLRLSYFRVCFHFIISSVPPYFLFKSKCTTSNSRAEIVYRTSLSEADLCVRCDDWKRNKV